jgi:hypothetical protein
MKTLDISKQVDKLEQGTNLTFINSSGGNDLCQNFMTHYENRYTIFFPNSLVNDESNEEFNTYCIFDNEDGDYPLEDATLEQVIEYINNNKPKFK